jgi:hypothetical protein
MKISPLAWIFGCLADCEELGAALVVIGLAAAFVGIVTLLGHHL